MVHALKTVFSAMVVVSGMATATQAQEQEPIMIGVVGPFSGPLASNGDLMRDAARAFQSYTNANGGIMGRSVRLSYYDDACNTQQGVDVVNKMDGDGVELVVGPFCSTVTLAVRDNLREFGMTNVTLSQSDDITGETYGQLFRITPPNARLSDKIIDTILETKRDQVFIFHANNGFGLNLAQLVGDALRQSGKDIEIDKFPEREVDFSAVSSKIINSGVDTVFLAGSSSDIGNAARQLRLQGYEGRLVLPGTGTLAEYSAVVGCPYVENSYPIAADDRTFQPENASFLAEFEKIGVVPRDNILFTWAALDVLRQAIEKAQTTQPDLVAQEIHRGIFDTPQGMLDFASEGEAAGNLVDPPVARFQWTCDASIPTLTK